MLQIWRGGSGNPESSLRKLSELLLRVRTVRRSASSPNLLLVLRNVGDKNWHGKQIRQLLEPRNYCNELVPTLRAGGLIKITLLEKYK